MLQGVLVLGAVVLGSVAVISSGVPVAAQARPAADPAVQERLQERAPDPVDRILARRAELRLSGEQVAALREIQRELRGAQEPVLARLLAARGPAAGRGAEARQALAELRRQHARAYERTRRVLTPEQCDCLWPQLAEGVWAPPSSRAVPARGAGWWGDWGGWW
jgi:hypothetical protein